MVLAAIFFVALCLVIMFSSVAGIGGEASTAEDNAGEIVTEEMLPDIELIYHNCLTDPFETVEEEGKVKWLVDQLTAKCHWRYWSLLPAAVAVALCWITREPVTALLGGIVAGAFLLGRYDITDGVLLDSLASENAAGVLILYLWLLGGLIIRAKRNNEGLERTLVQPCSIPSSAPVRSP